MKTSPQKQRNHKISLFSLSLLLSITIMAQPGIVAYTETGSNNVSHGPFIKSAVLVNYKSGKTGLETGFQNDLMNYKGQILSGYTLNTYRDFMLKGIRMGIKGFYTSTVSSRIIHESNIGGVLSMKFDHFSMAFGTNYRTFSLKRRNIGYEIERSNSRIHEAGNFMYLFSYNLNPEKSQWNAGISITNYDHFVINQETNPMVSLNGSFRMKPRVSLYAQAWYKVAGVSNMELNYFGYYIKTGVIWNFQ
jgi:hypothetical protein